jgi:hypothetical protein
MQPPVRAVGLVLAVLAIGGCGDDTPAEAPQAAYGPVGAGFCADLDPGHVLASAAPGLSWSVSPESVATGVDPVVCTLKAVDPDPPGFRTFEVDGDPSVHVVVDVTDDDADGRACYDQLVDGQAAATGPAEGGAEPEPVDGWWEDGSRQDRSEETDSGLATGEGPAELGTSTVTYAVRDANACITVQVDDLNFDAVDIPARLERADRIARLLLERLPDLLTAP